MNAFPVIITLYSHEMTAVTTKLHEHRINLTLLKINQKVHIPINGPERIINITNAKTKKQKREMESKLVRSIGTDYLKTIVHDYLLLTQK